MTAAYLQIIHLLEWRVTNLCSSPGLDEHWISGCCATALQVLTSLPGTTAYIRLAQGHASVPNRKIFMMCCASALQGFLSSPYTATYYKLAQRHADVPRMTEKQYEALRLYNALALSDKLRLDLMLQAGDIQLLSNHTQIHTRSAFVDHPVRAPIVHCHEAQPAQKGRRVCRHHGWAVPFRAWLTFL